VVLVADTSILNPDGRDALVVNVHVVDQQGREVPDAQNLIHFSLEGKGAHFIGVGNGDPSSHDPEQFINDGDWQRPLFNGKCQVIVQSGKEAASLTLRAKAEGLQDGIFAISIGQ
jgi:beta-galactosidase